LAKKPLHDAINRVYDYFMMYKEYAKAIKFAKNMDFELTKHTQDMLKERNIPEEWVWRTINNPE